MLTPIEIQNKKFNKSFRGYSEKEVDRFLDKVIVDYENIFKENLELKKNIELVEKQVNHYDSMEDTLQKTLVVAQSTADDLVDLAKKQADTIVKESEFKAEKIVEDAKNKVTNSTKEYERIRKEILMFRTKYKSMLSSQLEVMDHYSDDDYSFSILQDVKNIENIDNTEEEIVTDLKIEVLETSDDVDNDVVIEQKEA